MGIKKRNKATPVLSEGDALKVSFPEKTNLCNINIQDAGNRAFSDKDYEKAIDLYTQAISKNSQNHVFFANSKFLSQILTFYLEFWINILFLLYFSGANAYLESGKHENCILDCDQAIKLNENYIKVRSQTVLEK